jgi:hypothetical protein
MSSTDVQCHPMDCANASTRLASVVKDDPYSRVQRAIGEFLDEDLRSGPHPATSSPFGMATMLLSPTRLTR